jgi:hypothetical protein
MRENSEQVKLKPSIFQKAPGFDKYRVLVFNKYLAKVEEKTSSSRAPSVKPVKQENDSAEMAVVRDQPTQVQTEPLRVENYETAAGRPNLDFRRTPQADDVRAEVARRDGKKSRNELCAKARSVDERKRSD